MRYRGLSATGDYTFGAGQLNFLINSPDAVAQAIATRLRLLRGEWFLDSQEGTPYATEILGNNTAPTYDAAIRRRILGTTGVVEIVPGSYSSAVVGRALSVAAKVNTRYGQVTIRESL